MKIFHCDHCNQLVYFENTTCLSCGHVLAFLPEGGGMCSLEADGAGNWLWPGETRETAGAAYRLCQNYVKHNVCNWAVRADDPIPFCLSCRLNQTIPDLKVAGNQAAWARLERAKRRLIYSLLSFKLPIVPKSVDPEHGLAFNFLANDLSGSKPVLTGHEEGLITLNIAEADDALREKHRLEMGEPYRTLLGHFRHEVGHYYWDILIKDTGRLSAFRAIFGDESASYEEALRIHYAQGAPANWQQNFISSYATTHPWEDWAETWAHYLHMSDTLETTAACGLSLSPARRDEPQLQHLNLTEIGTDSSFDQLIERWYPLTYVLNNLNRGLGLGDSYPFVISRPVEEKLRFVHETLAGATKSALLKTAGIR